jgi:hypothetical protein
MSIQPAWQESFLFFDLPIVVEPSAGQLSSDAGLLPIREFDERLRFTEQFARALHDPRTPSQIEHSFVEMVRSRVYGILADYEDQNDHDTLRHDPVFKLLADRSIDDPDLASQPTLSRFENSIDIPSLNRLRDLFIDQFIASFSAPPKHLTFDLDAVDDPTHGHQQLSLFHGYFDQYQYFPAFITSADTDQFVVLALRPGAVHAALGADDDLEYLVRRVRQAWPGVRILVRGDAGYGVPWMYDVCERLDIDYLFGLAANAVLKARSDALLERAVQQFEAAHTPQRLFDAFWYRAESWPALRWVIVKAEANAQGTNRRFIVTNRPGAFVAPEAAYDDYALRGESENRNKEFKCDLAMDRTSDHRFLANFFRLYLHAAAHNLLVRLRRVVADPPTLSCRDVPIEALIGEDRQRHFRLRRQHDPLGEGQPRTWRSLLIKVAAEITVSTRRLVVRLAANWPHLNWYRHVCQRLALASAVVPIPSQ